MACFSISFSQVSKCWIAILLPFFAVLVSFSSAHAFLSIPILLLLFRIILYFTRSKQRKILMEEADREPSTEENSQKNDDVKETALQHEENLEKREAEESEKGFLLKEKDVYSESESMDHFSSNSSEEHSSDIEYWPYSMEQRLDCSDDSISDEESLIEIAIPSGEFVSQNKEDQKLNLKCYKFSATDFLADMNEITDQEDNLIEIDIYMGSIKCSSFQL